MSEYAGKAALYMRSAAGGATDPCVEQRERLARMAENLGMEVAGEYADGCSWLPSGNRPQFQKMLSDAKAGLFGHLLVRDLSRFSHDQSQLWTLNAAFQRLGVSIHTADGFVVKPQDGVIAS